MPVASLSLRHVPCANTSGARSSTVRTRSPAPALALCHLSNTDAGSRPSVQFPGATERAKKREGPRRKRTPTARPSHERRVFTFNYGSKKGPRGIEAPRSEERNCAVTKGEPFRHNSFWGISASSQLESITLAVSIDRSNTRERLGNPMRPFSAYSSPERWLSLNRRRRPNHSCTLRGAAALV